MKVLVHGSYTLSSAPQEVINHIAAIMEHTKGDVEFLVGDSTTFDTSIHMALSRLGASSNATVYGVDATKHNKFDFKEVLIKREELEEDIKYTEYEAKDRKMIDDCDFAIVAWDRSVKQTFKLINILKAQDKHVYVY